MDTTLIVGAILIIGITITIFYSLIGINQKRGDEIRWKDILAEMRERYPDATYKAQLEFIRRDRYAALRSATENNEDIVLLTEEYQMIVDEQERIVEGERQLGAEFDPYVANHHL